MREKRAESFNSLGWTCLSYFFGTSFIYVSKCKSVRPRITSNCPNCKNSMWRYVPQQGR
jgi:hypothetical protein